ncbi:ribonuclease HII [Sporolactobacillus sp. THM7-7]|nr:ribonuclease HII [Sporolactobacillus sp. THM7-7]
MEHLTIAQWKDRLETASPLTDEEKNALSKDSRKGVRRLYLSWKKQQQLVHRLLRQFQEMNRFENKLRQKGKRQIAGIDEAGRGPLAGPVVAACVMLKPDAVILGLNDSKQLTAAKRAALFEQIQEEAKSIGIGVVSAREIDRINIYQAARKAMTLAVGKMKAVPDHLLIDAMDLPLDIPQTSLIKGDACSNSIAAASIIAKVTRDRIMQAMDTSYPGYGFADHKGYGTRMHLKAIDRLGPCPEHRMSFAPLKK